MTSPLWLVNWFRSTWSETPTLVIRSVETIRTMETSFPFAGRAVASKRNDMGVCSGTLQEKPQFEEVQLGDSRIQSVNMGNDGTTMGIDQTKWGMDLQLRMPSRNELIAKDSPNEGNDLTIVFSISCSLFAFLLGGTLICSIVILPCNGPSIIF